MAIRAGAMKNMINLGSCCQQLPGKKPRGKTHVGRNTSGKNTNKNEPAH